MSRPKKTSSETPAPREVAAPPASAPETPEYKPHDLASLFPSPQPDEFDALVIDIKEHGQRDRILLTPDAQILDGWSRYRACLKAGVAPLFETTTEPPEKWLSLVISKNLVRRHLTPSQRAASAAELVNTRHGTNQHSKGAENFPVLTQADAAGMFHVNDRYVRDAVAVKRASEGLHGLVKAGRLSASEAPGVVRVAPGRTDTFVELVEGGKQPEEALREIVTTAGKPTRADKPTLRKKGTGTAKDSQLSQKSHADPDEEYAELLHSKFEREEILILIPLIEVARPKQVVEKLRERLAPDVKAAEAAAPPKKPARKKKEAKTVSQKQPVKHGRTLAATRGCFLQPNLQQNLRGFRHSDQPEAKDEEIVRKLREKSESVTDEEAHQRFDAYYSKVRGGDGNPVPKEKIAKLKYHPLARQAVVDDITDRLMNDLGIDTSKAPWKLGR